MTVLRLETPKAFAPLLPPARYKGAYGGRASGKSHFFAEHLIEYALASPGETGEGLRSVCMREVQKDLSQSAKLLIESKLQRYGIGEADGFKVFEDVIQLPQDGLCIFRGMNNYTADSIKSLEGFRVGWWEEAHTATPHSLALLRPTIMRNQGAELWFSWNPRKKDDPVDVMFRGGEQPTGSKVVRVNWRDNPFLDQNAHQERLDCLRMTPEQYDHIWEGGYVTVLAGAYYAKQIAEARQYGRIGKVGPDPLLTYRAFVDIGGTGSRADAFACWIAQFVGQSVHVLNYYEAVGQPLAAHLEWIRSQGYTTTNLQWWLPHDGATHDRVSDASYEKALREVGFQVTVVPNQGKGAAKQRIEAMRRKFPLMWFNESTTSAGLDALGWYHEKRDDARGIGLGPEHDWASHGADAAGLMAVCHEPPQPTKLPPLNFKPKGIY